jgi:hypothetical protein
MKVKALFHIIQRVGSLSVERVKDTEFDLPEDEAIQAAAQGLVKVIGAGTTTVVQAKARLMRKDK